jgi:GntR family transcriptional regulator/MocR family aminotransferase
MDEKGVLPQALADAQVLHISPSHHFPTGIITPMDRRQALLAWAGRDKWIIEDDYDSEFRFLSRPMAAMASMDRQGRVIYMNTFSKSLAPSIRISYMVLPQALMERFQQTLGFYSCTVPSFQQYTLARFIERGYLEKHINRMRKRYKVCRNRVLAALENSPFGDKISVLEENAGLHFLLKVDTPLTDENLTAWCEKAGFRVQTLGEFYHSAVPESAKGQLVINYSGLTDEDLTQLEQKLAK